MYRAILYYFAMFLSFLGDALLVSAVPIGLGVESDDLRYTAAMYLIPGIAMFLASYLAPLIRTRQRFARLDYGRMLIIVSLLEVVTAGAVWIFTSKGGTLIVCCIFVFLYAASKEGLTRLFYNVSTHRYFSEPASYPKVVGRIHALQIIGFFLGTIMAAYLIGSGGWRLALILDAMTFLILGGVIILFGKDADEVAINNSEESVPVGLNYKELKMEHIAILRMLPIMMGVSILIWPYLPILSEKFNITSVELGVVAIAFLSLPGMLSGFIFNRLVVRFSMTVFVVWLPLLYIFSCLLFVVLPNIYSLSMLILARGMIQGLYWSADTTCRNQLSANVMITFNEIALRSMASTQMLSCILAVFAYSFGMLQMGLTLAIGLYILVLIYKYFGKRFDVKIMVGLSIAMLVSACKGE